MCLIGIVVYVICDFWQGAWSCHYGKRNSSLLGRPDRCQPPPSLGWRPTCPSEGVLNLVATGSETAGLIRRRRRRAPIGWLAFVRASQRAPSRRRRPINQSFSTALTAGAGTRRRGGWPLARPDGSSSWAASRRPLLLLPPSADEPKAVPTLW